MQFLNQVKNPKDFSIIGNDDIPTSKISSSFQQGHPKYDIGKKAVEILINELEQNKSALFEHIRYEQVNN